MHGSMPEIWGFSTQKIYWRDWGIRRMTWNSIHIAGTNGKGSVAAYIATVLQCAGYRVGRYVSPTIYSYRERIQINEEYISKEDFTIYMEQLIPVMQQMEAEGLQHPTPFEIETVLSFLYFQRPKV